MHGRALLMLLIFAACSSAHGQISFTPPADGTLAACYPTGNNADLSSDGCLCLGNNDCKGVCPVGDAPRKCAGGDNIQDPLPACFPGNAVDASADGCPCVGNNECGGVCPINPVNGDIVRKCIGLVGSGGPSDPVPGVCVLGNSGKVSADGCPCTNSSECNNSTCSTTTHTCGGLVGKVYATVPTLSSARFGASTITLGGSSSVLVSISNTYRADGRLSMFLYSPAVANPCNPPFLTFPVHSDSIAITSDSAHGSNFAPTAYGTYQWRIRYSGDAFNVAVQEPCPDTTLQFTLVDRVFSNGFE